MNINEFLKNNDVIFDGAMGTYYANYINADGVYPHKCELANLNSPEIIEAIHKEYISAGCNAIRTNTFCANTISLECNFGTVKQVIESGWEIACNAIKTTETAIFADIGPIPITDTIDIEDEYKKIINVFLSLGAENFIFETFGSDEYLLSVTQYIKEKKPNAFIITEFAVSPDGFTRIGLSGEKLFRNSLKCEFIDAVGFNCISGPHHLLQYIKRFTKDELNSKIISIMPNAGYPTVVDNRTFFENSSAYFSQQMCELSKIGVKILGGCCGTTPIFIQKTVEKLNSQCCQKSQFKDIQTIQQSEKIISKNTNILLEKMEQGKKIIAVELDPPLDDDASFFMEGARKLKEHGVDAITIADCPLARARADSSLLACKLKRELDITPIPHMTCRDRNINATKALLLGMRIEGIQNVLVVTGDPIPSAQRDEVKSMFSFNSAILANHIKTLNETIFQDPFNIFGALNINAINFDSQIKHALKKTQNGVTAFLTQPVLTKEAFENLKKAKELLPAKILGGIIPVVSYRNACFMNNEISGITVSEEIIEMYKDLDKEQAHKLAIEISVEIAKQIGNFVDGYYLMTPFKNIELISKIIDKINLL